MNASSFSIIAATGFSVKTIRGGIIQSHLPTGVPPPPAMGLLCSHPQTMYDIGPVTVITVQSHSHPSLFSAYIVILSLHISTINLL